MGHRYHRLLRVVSIVLQLCAVQIDVALHQCKRRAYWRGIQLPAYSHRFSAQPADCIQVNQSQKPET